MPYIPQIKIILFGGEYYLFKGAVWGAIILLIGFKFILRFVGTDASLKKIDVMSGEDFEFYVANTLQKYGFRDVAVTNGGGDFGVDVLGTYKKIRYAVQVKRYKSLVGIAAVQEAYSGAKYYEADAAIVITNSHFTDAAKELAESCNVILMNRRSFISKSFINDLNQRVKVNEEK